MEVVGTMHVCVWVETADWQDPEKVVVKGRRPQINNEDTVNIQ